MAVIPQRTGWKDAGFMNIEAYNLDSLRKLVRSLQDENRKLKAQLEKANIAYESENLFEEKIENAEEYDPDQGGRIISKYITEDLVNRYFAMFWGRTDVYAKRGAKGGYFPQCNNRWNNRICPKQQGIKISCEACEHRSWTKLEPKKIIEHLCGYREDGADKADRLSFNYKYHCFKTDGKCDL